MPQNMSFMAWDCGHVNWWPVWIPWFYSWYPFTIHYYTYANARTQVLMPLFGSGYQSAVFPYNDTIEHFSEYKRTWSYDRRSVGQSVLVSGIHCWIQLLTGPAYVITARIVQKEFLLLLQWKHACLRNCYLAMDDLYLLISRPLSNKGSTCHSICIFKKKFRTQGRTNILHWRLLIV
jgi:hypothetical protein